MILVKLLFWWFMNNFQGLVFWTYCIRSHFFQVINEISKKQIVIVAVLDYNFRDLGIYHIPNAEIILLQTYDDVKRLINKTRLYLHINNYFKPNNISQLLYLALKYINTNKIECISLFQEQYPYWGMKGFLRRIQWWYIFHVGVGKYIKALGCTGKSSITAYKKAGVSEEKMFEFIYSPYYDIPIIDLNKHQYTKFIFVGQLNKRKQIIELLDVFKKIHNNYSLVIIGDGELKEEIINKIGHNNQIRFLGNMPVDKVQQELALSDVLILPSEFDGWGCVVNEAISQGLRVIVSNACGSHSLIENRQFLGQVYPARNKNALLNCLDTEIKRGPLSIEEKNRIIMWSKKITPQIEGDYFFEVLTYYYGDRQEKPVAPWS